MGHPVVESDQNPPNARFNYPRLRPIQHDRLNQLHVNSLQVPVIRTLPAQGLFQLQMIISFPFSRAKYLRTSLLIIRNRSFCTLLYIGGTYTQGQGGGQRPPPSVGGTYAQVQGGG